MDRIALQILEDSWKHDARVMHRATETLEIRLQEQTDGRWAAAAFEINRITSFTQSCGVGSPSSWLVVSPDVSPISFQ